MNTPPTFRKSPLEIAQLARSTKLPLFPNRNRAVRQINNIHTACNARWWRISISSTKLIIPHLNHALSEIASESGEG